MGVQENVLPNGSQTGYVEGTTGAAFGLVGEKYGWMVEISPGDPGFRPRKHSWLGRFRHENAALRAEAGDRLVVYMGDDRRGGHVWKFVSNGSIGSPTSPSNSNLFESGTLYVANFNSSGATPPGGSTINSGSGVWIPLVLSTPPTLRLPLKSLLRKSQLAWNPSETVSCACPSGTALAALPRTAVLLAPMSRNESEVIPQYLGQTLADFYPNQGALLADAFLAANLIGGTPSARPEDIEVHPRTKEVYIAFTDATSGGDGVPDSRVFLIGKLSSAVNASYPIGSIVRIIEDSSDGAGTTFTWERLNQSGEVGSVGGSGFTSLEQHGFRQPRQRLGRDRYVHEPSERFLDGG